MKKLTITVLTVLILLPIFAEAQMWKRYNKQIVFGAGVTNFLGDLGGGDGIGRNGPLDMNLAATRPSLLVGYRYQLNNFMLVRSNLTWGILSGDDERTDEPARQGRNLRFRSGFFELTALAEFYVLQNKRGSLYRLRGVKGKNGLGLDIYLFGGVGLMYFNPKGQYQTKWVPLQPMGTEGQGLPGQPEKYSRLTVTIPYGIGIGKTINRYWSVNLEATMRVTFTDYLDDVSGNYYGRDKLRQAKIRAGYSKPEADRIAYLSDPNIYHQFPGIGGDNLDGQQRGNPDNNDSFVTLMASVSRKIIKRRRSRPKF